MTLTELRGNDLVFGVSADRRTPCGKAALAKIGIEDFRWRDLRDTWASWHAYRGTPLHVVQELVGWASMQMMRRYAHLSTDHLAEHVTKFAVLHQTAWELLPSKGQPEEISP